MLLQTPASNFVVVDILLLLLLLLQPQNCDFNMNKSGTIQLCPFVPEPTDPFRYYLHNFVCKTCIGKMSPKQTLDNIGKVMK